MNSELSMDQALIEKLTKILEVNLDKENFGVIELAIEAGLSRSQLHRKLKSIVGKSASRFIREYRLQKAMDMLQRNVATASEIAYRVGFNSPTYFNTCFHDYYGYPPGEAKIRNPDVNNQNEDEQVIKTTSSVQKQSDTPSSKKSILSKRMVWINTFFILLLSVLGYNLYQNYKEHVTVQSDNNDVVEKSIAIIPFKSLNKNVENRYFADGITGSIQNHLSKISGLKVVPKTNMEKYRESLLTTSEIGKEEGVLYLLDGSVQKHGDSIRVITHLIDVKENNQLSSFVFDWKYKNIFEIQRKIALQIAEELDVKIAQEELETIEELPTNNLEAYNIMLQANYLANKNSKSSWENSVVFYKKAIQLDSTYIEAYVKLAYSYIVGGLIWGSFTEHEAWENAKRFLEKANQFDSTNPDIDRALTVGLYFYEWNFKRMEKNYKNSGIPFLYEIHTGRYEKSLATISQYFNDDPTNGFVCTSKAQALFFLNRNDEAISLLKKYDELFNDDLNYLREGAKYYFYLKEFENSKKLLSKFMLDFSERPPIIIWLKAVYEEMDGNIQNRNKYLEELQKKYKEQASGSPAWFIALYYCVNEDYENAFVWLQKSYDRHEVEMLWLREEPLLIPLRNDPRYLDLYKKVGFPMQPHVLKE